MAVHIKKREDYISWDEYFMGVAMLSGMRSKDPNSQVGACIVSNDNKILSMGYNGFPKGCSDDEFPWAREGENPLETKYVYSTHSELNAILNYSGGSLVGGGLGVGGSVGGVGGRILGLLLVAARGQGEAQGQGKQRLVDRHVCLPRR